MACSALLQSAVSLLSLSLLSLVPLVQSRSDGLALTPPMGWMAWERYRCDVNCKEDPDNCISEQLFRDMADRLSEDGWRELGYEYVMIDDCWMFMARDKEGRLQPDPVRFPSGIAKLAEYIHNRGLKLGIYADMGTATCMGFPGTTLDKIELDAQTFASWGVDYLKFDGCNSNALDQFLGYPLMSKALNATGRPIVFSCSWPVYVGSMPPEVNYTLLGEICHLWRNWFDIQDSWDSVTSITDWFFKNQDYLQPAAGPGGWNDPDMLIIGNFGLSLDQSRAQMALWAIMAAPLIMSNNLKNLDNAARAILQNCDVISINQDPLGIQGRRLLQEKSGIEVFWRPLVDSGSALVFFSRRRDMPYRYRTSLETLGYDKGTYEVRDVFEGSKPKLLKSSDQFTVSINPSGVVMWRLSPTKTQTKLRLDLNQDRNQDQSKAKSGHHTLL